MSIVTTRVYTRIPNCARPGTETPPHTRVYRVPTIPLGCRAPWTLPPGKGTHAAPRAAAVYTAARRRHVGTFFPGLCLEGVRTIKKQSHCRRSGAAAAGRWSLSGDDTPPCRDAGTPAPRLNSSRLPSWRMSFLRDVSSDCAGAIGNIGSVIRSCAAGSDEAWHSAQARARHTSNSAYVWLDYAMIRHLSRRCRL